MKKIIILILILTSYKSKSQCLSGDCNNGYGQYQYGNGGIYKGNFKNGLENGSGTIILASGAKYIGEFYNGKKNGKGIYYYTSGEIQDGDFVNGNFVNGKDKLASGDTYIGEFLNGVWNGNGTYIWADGEKYVGGFKNGVFHGIGKKYLINGNIVEGEWSNGSMIKKTVQNTVTKNTNPLEEINCELSRKKYLEQNPDVAKAGVDAWIHYTSYGKREGRKWPACSENAKNSNYTSDYDFGINTITYSYSGNSQSDEFYVKKQILMSSLAYMSVNFIDHIDINQKELKKKELTRMCELFYKKFPILKQEVLDMFFSSEQQNKYNNSTVPEIYAFLAEVSFIDNNSFNKSVWSKLPIKIDGVQLNNSALKTNSTNLPPKTNDNIILNGYNVGRWNYNDNSKSIVCLVCKKQCAVKKSTEEIEKEKLKKIKDIENGHVIPKNTFEARMKFYKKMAQYDGISPEEYVFKNYIKDNPSDNKIDLFDAAYNYWNLNYSLFFIGHFCSETHLNTAAKIYDAEAKKNMENARSSSNSSSNSAANSNSQSSSNPSKTNNPSLTTSIKQAPTKGFEFEIVVKWDATTMNGECATNFQLINCKMDHFSPTKNCSFSVEPTCPKCHHSSLENTKTGWCLQSHFPEECIKKFKVTCKYCDK